MLENEKKVIQDDRMTWIESDIEKIQLKQNFFIQEYGDEGIFHIAREGIQNSFDEVNNPKSIGNKIVIDYDISSDIITVTDNSRGIPETDVPLEIVCTKNQAGSKFFRESGNTSGEFGVGLTVINALSDIFVLESYREKEGTVHRLEFENGIKKKDTIEKITKSGMQHGTVLKFKASEKYFGKGSKFPYEKCVNWLETLMHFPMDNPNIKVEMNIFDIMKLKKSYIIIIYLTKKQ